MVGVQGLGNEGCLELVGGWGEGSLGVVGDLGVRI